MIIVKQEYHDYCSHSICTETWLQTCQTVKIVMTSDDYHDIEWLLLLKINITVDCKNWIIVEEDIMVNRQNRLIAHPQLVQVKTLMTVHPLSTPAHILHVHSKVYACIIYTCKHLLWPWSMEVIHQQLCQIPNSTNSKSC